MKKKSNYSFDKIKSLNAVKKAIGSGDYYNKNTDVVVSFQNHKYFYHHISVIVTYNYTYRQMEIVIQWDDDTKATSYELLGLHKGYNSNFQNFNCQGRTLQWDDGNCSIYIDFS